MISFFRKIRQKLLSQNRVTRYLVYALGEIFLVVIGILIALQVNIWNENRKDRALEKNYLLGIAENLDSDIKELERLIVDDSLLLNGYTNLVRAFSDKAYKSNPKALIETIFKIQLVNSYEGNHIVFDDLNSSGSTYLVQSDSLRYHLLEYYNQSEVLITSEQELHNPGILELRKELFITDEVGINGLERLFFPPYWASDLDPSLPITTFLEFLDEDIHSSKVQGFANRAGYIKALTLAKRIDRIRLLKSALTLREEIQGFLLFSKN
ncbi:MAG: hypothetical protein HWE15_02380 [Algoriphagus sp.]|uniref:hypothetical protein n=1 Tax=Algoriphagus sp. TaxID=1872435 RepID=UPI0018180D03|nr:hypothetical protein [Algoriphagus sp.]NVJ85119.1 hypothetical protein [Algoriphagus sp.]